MLRQWNLDYDDDGRAVPRLQFTVDVCGAEATPARCAMLTAVFAHGSVVAQPLPETLKNCRLVE